VTEPQELAKLHDIHLPDPIGWWPMAAGWYLLIILALVSAALLIYSLRRFYEHGRAKREALLLLRHYEQDYQRGADSQLISMKISELLRRVALAYFPRAEVAGLKGKAWLDFLTRTSKGIDFKAISDYLLTLPYQPAKEIDLELLFCTAKRWIRQRGKPCLN
jgi:hypothetical protein